jgi:hypothetical protein
VAPGWREEAQRLVFHMGEFMRIVAQAAQLARPVQMHDRVDGVEHLFRLVDFINLFGHNR